VLQLNAMNAPRPSFRSGSGQPWRNLRRRPGLLIAIVLLAALASRFTQDRPPVNALPSQTEAVRVKRVVDGDTLLLDSGVRVRLLGIDTPETKKPDHPVEPFGPEASEFTRKMVEGKMVNLEYDRERLDQFGRTLAYVYIDGRMLNEALIEAGLTRAEVKFHFRNDRKKRFKELEQDAREHHRGIWSTEGRQIEIRPAP
jgi:micrococcal nuclease